MKLDDDKKTEGRRCKVVLKGRRRDTARWRTNRLVHYARLNQNFVVGAGGIVVVVENDHEGNNKEELAAAAADNAAEDKQRLRQMLEDFRRESATTKRATCPYESLELQKSVARDRLARSSSSSSSSFEDDTHKTRWDPYETRSVYPDWIVQHEDYTNVDKIIRDEQLCQALAQPPHARTSKQLSLLEMYLHNVWATAERLGSVGVKEIAKTAGHRAVEKDEVVVREGDRGVTFYILVAGNLDVYKTSVGGKVATLKPGHSFGEASLGPGAPPRNATIVCVSDRAQLLVLHKQDYDKIMRDFQNAENRRAFRCMKNVPLFASWSRTRLHQLCSSLQWNHFKKGERIITQGDPCDNVYFIIDGKCQVTKDVHIKSQNRWPKTTRSWVTKTCTETVTVKLMVLGPNDYFGEKGILQNMPRAATVTTMETSVIVSLDRVLFIDLLQRGHTNPFCFHQYAGESNMGYATENDIISVVLATGKQNDDRDDATTQRLRRRQANVAGRLFNKNVETASAVSLLSTGSLLNSSKLLSFEIAMERQQSKNKSRPTTPPIGTGPPRTPGTAAAAAAAVLAGNIDIESVSESTFDEDSASASPPSSSSSEELIIPTWESARNGPEVLRAKRELDARLQHYRDILERRQKAKETAPPRKQRLVDVPDDRTLAARSLTTTTTTTRSITTRSLTTRSLPALPGRPTSLDWRGPTKPQRSQKIQGALRAKNAAAADNNKVEHLCKNSTKIMDAICGAAAQLDRHPPHQ
ncbi:hypothetical protein CTAYLR_002057 [Chrysophaeum taylorii]|uniref:Cyclic nucleotide-binding domain-containing protein n=1 Tax=Chrysophaeum taylorii TaxID=2483200 RepID=A0AAD7XPZ2_9STRA|nr:hypothetical protein CTAYLR_002057 [Chrysophaeum taylorii]